VAAVRQPAARWPALKRFRTAPGVRSVMLNHFCVVIVDLPWPSTSSLRKPCKKDVDARDNSRIKSGGRHGGGGWFDDIGTSLRFAPSRSAEAGEVTSLLTATNLPKADMTNR
jgi:hypothetical protein